jgi:ribosome-associated heat shock protein Hsp15
MPHENDQLGPLRIDKWLWAARFFKTRALATAACDAGHVSSNGQTAKPSRIVKVGDKLQVRSDAGDHQIEVLALSDQRGSAAIAQELYRESQESRELRAKVAAERRALFLAEPSFTTGRPNKRDRRLIHKFSGRD